VDVGWRRCAGAELSIACDAPPGSSELLLQIVKSGTARRDADARLGDALVVRRAGGVLATVHVGSVASLAKTTGTDLAVLLGRVIAHELGHLMMHGPAHARRGLMRPNWTPEEVRRNLAADWAFTAADAAEMSRPAPQ
jgi:hypothetical protein